MANRVLIGNRGSDYGIFISREGQNVASTTSSLVFDSNAVKGFNTVTKGQGILSPGGTRSFSHGLGFKPYASVTYCFPDDINESSPSNTATVSVASMYVPFFTDYWTFGSANVSITSAGSGYIGSTVPFTATGGVAYTGAGGTVQATGYATISSNTITSITITNTPKYGGNSPVPTITLTGGAGDLHASQVYPAYDSDIIPAATQYGSLTKSGYYFQYDTVGGIAIGDGITVGHVGVSFTTNTTHLTISNDYKEGYQNLWSGMAWSNTAFGGEETIYYSYLIYNGTSPFA
jgi:hypothetical protein